MTENNTKVTDGQRLDYKQVSPEAFDAIHNLTKFVKSSGLDENIVNLVNIRASQMNGCAWCLNMHMHDAKNAGEQEQRLYMLPVWREMLPLYSEREQAALEWTECVTLLAQEHVPDDVYQRAKQQFSEKELVDLTMAVIAINSWNRLNVSFKTAVACEI